MHYANYIYIYIYVYILYMYIYIYIYMYILCIYCIYTYTQTHIYRRHIGDALRDDVQISKDVPERQGRYEAGMKPVRLS
jgi:hypothetical protein